MRIVVAALLAAGSGSGWASTAYAHGANGYLLKPMDFADLRKQTAAFATFWLTYNQI